MIGGFAGSEEIRRTMQQSRKDKGIVTEGLTRGRHVAGPWGAAASERDK